MKQTRYYATGRRKTAIARVWLTPGSGKVDVNGRDLIGHFKRGVLQMKIEQPLKVTDQMDKVDIRARVIGGGLSGQAGALQLGIARALVTINAENRPPLKKEGLLTRDSRMVERKKPGRAKARKKFQFSKR